MKNLVLICFCSLGLCTIKAQTPERKLNVGLYGGFNQYAGDIANGFYGFNQAAYCHGGLSVSRYLTPHFDVELFATAGELGYWERTTSPRHFRISLNSYNLYLKYNFFAPGTFIRPYLFLGAGMITQSGLGSDNFVRNNLFDYSLPVAGGGLNFRLGPFFGLRLQETFLFTTADDMDHVSGGLNDVYLQHSLGLTFNIGKKKRGPSDGVGDRIDACAPAEKGVKKRKESSNMQRKPRKSKSSR